MNIGPPQHVAGTQILLPERNGGSCLPAQERVFQAPLRPIVPLETN